MTRRRSCVPVVLVHYDAPDWCRQAVSSVLASEECVAVTVVDNGPDHSLTFDDDRVRVRQLENRGFAAAANAGVREWLGGDEPLCLIGSHDLLIEPDTVGRLVAAAATWPSVGIFAPDMPTNGTGAATGVDARGLTYRRWVSGGCMLLRRECIEQIGVFDEDFGSYGEDNEICARAWARGWTVATVDQARARGLGTAGTHRGVQSRANSVVVAFKVGGAHAAAVEWGRGLVMLARQALTARTSAGRTELVTQLDAQVLSARRVWRVARRRPGFVPSDLDPSTWRRRRQRRPEPRRSTSSSNAPASSITERRREN